jgi:C-terminal processing protease CtpA/Prc
LGSVLVVAQATPARQESTTQQAEESQKEKEKKAAEAKPAEGKAAEGKAAEGKAAEGKAAEGKAAEGKAAEGKAQRNTEGRATEAKTRSPAADRRRGETGSREAQSTQRATEGRTRPAEDVERQRRSDPRADESRRGDGEGRTADRDRRGRLGIQFDERAEGSLTVTGVDEGTAAAQAGLQVRDRIVSVDGRTITHPRQLQAYLRGQFGRAVPMIIERGGQRYTIQINPSQPEGDGAWLGVYLQDREGDQGGAQITNVYPSGPAARGGLRSGDVIVQVNGQRIASTPDLIAAVEGLEPQARAEFVVLRGNREVTIPVVLGNRENFVYYQGRQDTGDDDRGDYGRDGDRGGDYDFDNVPPYAMGLEHDRRMAEQHQRIEMELRKLQDEVRQLREAITQRREPNR